MKHIFTFFLFLGLITTIIAQNNAEYACGQLIVQYKSKEAYQRAASLRTNLDTKKLGASAELLIELWELPKDCKVGRECLLDPMEWAEYLAKNEENISFSQPNYMYGAGSLPPNDTAFVKQWYLHNTGWNGGTAGVDIGALAAWDIRRDAKYARVGIMDTGIDWKHPDLAPNVFRNLGEDADHDSTTLVWNGSQWVLDPDDLDSIDNDGNGYVDDLIGWDFVNNDNNPMDDNGHGTHVSGIIGAKQNNTTGISGISGAGIQMMPLKCLDASGTGYSFAILLALQYSINQGAIVTNHSYGGGAYDSLMFSYIDNNCKQAGQLLVAAAGNNNVNNDTDPMYPASYNSDIVISVGAHNNKEERFVNSNFGSNSVDIFAPGEAIYSTDLNGTYSFRTGTSMAAPMVTAAAALAWKQFPASTANQMKSRILYTATKSNSLSTICVSKARLSLVNLLSKYNDETFNTQNGEIFHANSEVLDIKIEGDLAWLATRHGVVKFNRYTQEKVIFNKTNSGLNHNSVNCITIDAQGHKWIGTAAGLMEFDGTNWYSHSTTPTYKITIDSQGNKWVITNALSAITKYDGITFTLYNLANLGFQAGKSISCLSIDQQNNKWIGTSVGLVLFNGINCTTYGAGTSANNMITSIAIDNQGNKWVTTGGLGTQLVKFDGTNWDIYYGNPNVSLSQAHNLLIDSQNNKWVTTSNGQLMKFNNTNWTTANITFPQPFSYTQGKVIRCMTEDNNGDKWLGTEVFGITKFNGNNWTFYSTENSELPMNQVKSIAIDNQNNKWVATSYAISKFDGINWTSYSNKNNGALFSKYFSSIAIDSQQNVWAGTNSGVVKFDGTIWTSYTNGLLANSNINCIYVDAQNNKWFGGEKGLAKLSGTTWTMYDTTNSGLSGNKIKCITVDKQGNKWIGTDKGFCKFDGATWTKYNSIYNGWVYSIAIDALGNKWIGTGSTVMKFNGGTPMIYNVWQNLGIGASCITIDKQDNKWILGTNGIAKLNGNNWITYTTYNSGLPNTPNCISVDSKGNKWIGTNDGGLFMFYELNSSFSVSKYSTCQNESFTFANQTTDADSFTWKINNQIVSTATNLTYTFTSAGVHRVELIAHKGSLDKSFFQYITVRAPVQVRLSNDTTVCHSSYVIDAGVAAEKYRWKNLAGTLLDPDSTHEEYYVTGAGAHTIVLEAVDYCGAVDRDTIIVTIAGDCVLPGDVNADGSVDMLDFLALKALQGQTGIPRPNASSLPYYQTCPNWSSWQPSPYNMVNKKHADCNGDGVIDILTDGAVIKQNATRIMRNQSGTDSTVYMLQLKRVNYNPYQWFYPWDTVIYDVIISTIDGQNLVGINKVSFSTRRNLNDRDIPSFDLTNSFLTNPYGMVIGSGKRADFGIISITSNNKPDTNAKVIKIRNPKKDKSIDTTHTTHSIFVTITLSNAAVGLSNGTNVKIHSNTSSNTETTEYRLPWTRLDLKAILQGVYDSTLQIMRADLQSQNIIPKKHPYGDIPPFKEVEIPAGVVDWVEMQLRSANNPTSANIVERRAAFLMQDGTIRSPYAEDSGHLYVLAKEGDYYVVINHRNHLSVMSQTPVYISANPAQNTAYDFTTSAAYNNGHIQNFGKNMLATGDANANGTVSYNGLNSDRESILNTLNAPNDKTKVVLGYYKEDVNLDGKVKYSGERNDRACILRGLGGTNVNATIQTQVPQ